MDFKPEAKTGEKTNGKRKEKEAKRKVFGRLLLIDNKESISPRDCCSTMVTAPSAMSVR